MTKSIAILLCLLGTICEASNADLARVASENANLRAQLATAQKQRDALATSLNNLGAITARNAEEARVVAEEAKAATDAAKDSADAAAKNSQSNNSLLYGSISANVLLFFGVVFQGVMKFVSDGRTHTWQQEASEKLDALKTNTDGLVKELTDSAKKEGHSQGILDERTDAGKTVAKRNS